MQSTRVTKGETHRWVWHLCSWKIGHLRCAIMSQMRMRIYRWSSVCGMAEGEQGKVLQRCTTRWRLLIEISSASLNQVVDLNTIRSAYALTPYEKMTADCLCSYQQLPVAMEELTVLGDQIVNRLSSHHSWLLWNAQLWHRCASVSITIVACQCITLMSLCLYL